VDADADVERDAGTMVFRWKLPCGVVGVLTLAGGPAGWSDVIGQRLESCTYPTCLAIHTLDCAVSHQTASCTVSVHHLLSLLRELLFRFHKQLSA